MNLVFAALDHRRLVFAAVLLVSGIGLVAWFTMDRQEDPFFPYRYGQILVEWPGAEPEDVARLIVQPLEEELVSVEEVREIRATARLGVGFLVVSMHQHVYDTDSAWDRIRVAVQRAERRFPAEAGPPRINDRMMESHGVVLSITGSDDLLELLEAARTLRRDLFRLPDIGRVEILGNPGEQLLLRVDPARLESLGLDVAALARQIEATNRTQPGGLLVVGGRSLVLSPTGPFTTLDELANTPIGTPTGTLLPLSEIADITLAPAEPATERIWSNGRPAIALGVVIPENRLNTVRFGRELRALLDELRPDHAPLAIEEVFFQPQWVERRIRELGRTLLVGVLIVATVLFAFMGLRLGLLVASLLPLVTLSALGVFAIGGGVLHQIGIAGMVIALGMLVDNAIVMAENLQWHLDRGASRREAANRAVRELAGPLAAATGTTIAAFTPLLLAQGDTADFTRDVPIMVMLILVVSYLYAMFVTPLGGGALLKPRRATGQGGFDALGRHLARIGRDHPGVVLVGAGLLLGLSLALASFLPRDFFPDTDRNQLVIDLTLPEGTRTEHTALAARGLAQVLAEHPAVLDTQVFAGFSGPRFYYNLMQIPAVPHRARLVLTTPSDRELPELLQHVRRVAQPLLPDAQITPRRLGQGPPLEAPVEILVYGRSTADLETAVDLLMRELRNIPGAVDVRHRLGTGMPVLVLDVDDAEAARHGLARGDIRAALAGATLGETASLWRAGREPVPMRLRTREGDRLSLESLGGLTLVTPGGAALPVTQFVRPRLVYQPAVIEHRDLRRMTQVLAETEPGVTYAQVLDVLMPRLATLSLPTGVELALGGAAEEAGAANSALFRSLPIGILLLLVFLLWQFNSFRLVGIVLATVPLAAVGVIPGLLLAGQPFGFMALLGVVALVGIVVNNAIVMVDVAEARRREGLAPAEAIAEAVLRRTRPILLTTTTTVAGLLPLTFTQSTLWPPMAWAIISGLIASSALTLLVVPVLYRLLMRSRQSSGSANNETAATTTNPTG
ncbi:MAG: efflux RND transporter permease subunit [Gammaproteobacteria bacterium]|nr:MAG: efflux RND transporter permease subunit [Gammaproteobacteria bacterium]